MEKYKGLKARQEFMRALLRHLGGVTKVARDLGHSKQFAENWIQRGGAPFVMTNRLQKLYGVAPFCMNYLDCCRFFGKESPQWAEVVEASPLTNLEKAHVLQYSSPEIPKDALWG